MRGPGTLAAGEEDAGAARAGTAGGEVGDLPVAAWVFLLVVVLPAGLEPGEGMEFCGSGADDATGLLRPSWGLRGGERSSRSRAAGAGAGGERGDDRGGVAASVWGRGVEAVRVVLGGEVAATGSAGLDVSEESELGRPRPLRRLSPCFGLLLRSLSTVLLMMGPRSCHCRAGRAGALLVGVRWGDGGGASCVGAPVVVHGGAAASLARAAEGDPRRSASSVGGGVLRCCWSPVSPPGRQAGCPGGGTPRGASESGLWGGLGTVETAGGPRCLSQQ